jgi:broad specificity phosphatase PhoE
LTEHGKEQCRTLRDTFPLHDIISIVFSSPLRRAIQTTILSFGPTLARQNVRFAVLPKAQEVSAKTCDLGFPSQDLRKEILALYAGQEVGFDLSKIEYDDVEDGWNSKVKETCKIAPTRPACCFSRENA